MSGSAAELVTVVVPAYNAAATIDETLLSVCAQSHARLEIIVVDDGSTDGTAAIVDRRRQGDSRILLVRQPNRGVAAARNAAIALGSGEFIAPVDADDLWHPRKIEKQLAAMGRGGPGVGLVYSWSAILDQQGRVTQYGGQYQEQGDVLKRLCEYNMVGNGSNPLLRAQAVRQAGGYDASLLALDAQGCEDWALYLAIAERFDFALVPEYLTGYRRSPASMSTDLDRMWRSFCAVEQKLRARRPDLARSLRQGLANMCHTLYEQARIRGLDRSANAYLRQLMLGMPYHALKAFVYSPLRAQVRRRFGEQSAPAPTGGHFLPRLPTAR